ncbi:TRAP transporter small permease [Nesterenkonia populi]|uniref:TRAP transporter small permease n=1 Tax=Nesterenkonia populi TaxID=1591087 RepID=UPI001478CB22|nr:TRAP transporter small permease [Nesterenkonia populi]
MAAIALVAMMTHIVLNALLRFGFGSPILGTHELVEYWYLPFLALAGIPAAQLNSEQIVVNLLTERMSEGTARVFALVTLSLALVFSLAVAWFGLQTALHQASIGASGGVINITVWPAYFLVPAMFLLLSILLFSDLVDIFRRMLTKESREPQGEPNSSSGRTS